jgi:hypothetical protein
MANFYNSNPIRIDTTFAVGTSWRSLQTLNTGNSPATLQQPNPSPRQWGIQVVELYWNSPGANGALLVTDPNDGTVLAMQDTPAGYTGGDIDITPITRKWRDFKVQITSGTLYIHYRA